MSHRFLHHGVRAALFAANTIFTAAACHKDTPVAPSPVAAKLIVVTPPGQLVTTAGFPLPGGVTVQVQDAAGVAIKGAAVAWVAFNGTTISTQSSTSDASGNATVFWTLGTTAGLDSLEATVGAGISIIAVATVQPGPVAQLIQVAGDGQVLGEGATSAPLQVKAIDKYGNPVPGVTVAWVDQSGGTLSANSVVTDASGMAQVTLTTDATAEQYSILAEVQSLPPVTFHEASQ